jgi:hypothetical protein
MRGFFFVGTHRAHVVRLSGGPDSNYASRSRRDPRATLLENPMSNEPYTRVVVTDIHMPFWSMVGFMVKWAIAAIPALIILAIIGALLSFAMTEILTSSSMRKTVDASPIEAPARAAVV